jgi:ATP-dependent helicase/nuclease subunit B
VPLSLIEGPPNSGRAGVILARLRASLARDPVLLVPTLDDADRFEAELCGDEGVAVLGASITTFVRLFDEVARATGVPLPPALTPTQRLSVIQRAVDRAELRVLARSAARPGFAPALASVIGELQAACLDPRTVAERAAADGGAYLREIAALYRGYAALRDELGYGDSHTAASAATAALRATPDAWGDRPVHLYGFDDLTVEQLELTEALSSATDVTVAVTYEDRDALAARAGTLGELQARGGKVVERREPDAANTESPVLYHLERRFLTGATKRMAPGQGLDLMEAGGERGQVEQIGATVAELLDRGTAPERIAVVLRDPNRYGALYQQVLSSYGIPVAVEASIPLSQTAVGGALLALLEVLSDGTADDLLAFLRTPGRARPDKADWLERDIRRGRLRSASEALEAWRARRGRELFELEDLRSCAGPVETLRTLARQARMIAEYPHQRLARVPDRDRRLELRAAATAARALEELAELPDHEAGASEAEAARCLESLEATLWRGPTESHVLVTSPYRIRARRVDHLFVASLQDGEFPRRDPGEPLLPDEQRAVLGLRERADPDDEERYLFHVCLSRPTVGLHLCWRSSDDEGTESPRSPFLDDVRELLDPPPPQGEWPDPLEDRVTRRTLADVVFEPARAPSLPELARSLAARPRNGDALAALKLDDTAAEGIRARVSSARERASFLPGPLSVPAVIDELRARDPFGASTLEGYALCSYRWFVDHELDPQSLDPQPEALTQGSLIHRVLEQLYLDPPTPERKPSPEALPAWLERARELSGARAAELGLAGSDPPSVAARARVEALVAGFLERDAASGPALAPDPELIEASFGEGERDSRPPLELSGLRLHGKIDRVDVPATEEAAGLVRDYKASREVTAAAKLADEGKLQLQLYALALHRLWDRRPIGALYQPLAATSDHRPRGLALASEREGMLAGLDLYKTDLLAQDDFERMLQEAASEAARIATQMREGRIARDPIDDECPSWCTFQAICRRERAPRQDSAPLTEQEDEEE